MHSAVSHAPVSHDLRSAGRSHRVYRRRLHRPRPSRRRRLPRKHRDAPGRYRSTPPQVPIHQPAPRLCLCSGAGRLLALSLSHHTRPGLLGGGPVLNPHHGGGSGHTPRRDAITLARLMRAGDLPPVHVPWGRRRPCGPCGGRGKRASAPERRPHVASQRCSCGRLSARRAGLPGARPLSGGAGRWSVPPRRRRASAKHMGAPCDHPARRQRLAPALQDQGQTWRRAPVVEALQARRGAHARWQGRR